MKLFRPICLAACAGLSLIPLSAPGQSPLGKSAATFPFDVSRLLADPVRDRVYAAVPSLQAVVVIDSVTMRVLANLPAGSNPVDLAISPDGATLYCADADPAAPAIHVFDPEALTTRAEFAMPDCPVAIAADLQGRMYVSILGRKIQILEQIDGTTGALLTTLHGKACQSGFLRITRDGQYLLAQPPFLEQTYDLSASLPKEILDLGAGPAVIFSGSADFSGTLELAPPDVYGPAYYKTVLRPVKNPTMYNFTSFLIGVNPGQPAFSPDGRKFYQTHTGRLTGPGALMGEAGGVGGNSRDAAPDQQLLAAFDIISAPLADVVLPAFGAPGSPHPTVSNMVTDRGGSHLFIAESVTEGSSVRSQLLVVTTGPLLEEKGTVTIPVGAPFHDQIRSALSPTSIGMSGLPEGLRFHPVTKRIQGIPQVPGAYRVTVSASNAEGADTEKFTMLVTDEKPVVSFSEYEYATSDDPAVPVDGRFLIKITRRGDLRKRLVVKYDVAGGARNGVDYQPLSGSARFALGASTAFIVVIPTPQSAFSVKNPIVLTLLPSSKYAFGNKTTFSALPVPGLPGNGGGLGATLGLP